MQINSDFCKRVAINTSELPWIDSPMPGVQRRMLDRIGNEVARATSIVKYEPGSHFSRHVHTGGEEFLVLDGVFQDEHGDFPVGSYVRNPPESSHKPGTESGCIIFVKLWQFDLADRTQLHLDINAAPKTSSSDHPDIRITPLFQDARETVRIEHWPANTTITFTAEGGSELLILAGEITEQSEQLGQFAWLRLPLDYQFQATTGSDPVIVWRKSGHLKNIELPAALQT